MRVHSVALSATLPYPLKGCCPDPITSNSGNVLNGVASYYGIFQHRYPKHRVPRSEGLYLVLGDFAAVPFVRSYAGLGGVHLWNLFRVPTCLHRFNFQDLFRVDVTTY